MNDHDTMRIKEVMNPVINQLSNRIDKLEETVENLKLEVNNFTALSKIIMNEIKRTEESYEVIKNFINHLKKEKTNAAVQDNLSNRD